MTPKEYLIMLIYSAVLCAAYYWLEPFISPWLERIIRYVN
jgi:hypothetical protein